MRPQRLQPTLWLGLWAVETPLTRGVQPSWLMAALATAILLACSALLLWFCRQTYLVDSHLPR